MPQKKKDKEHISWTEKAMALGTIVLAVATIFLSYYTFMLFKDASSANDRNKEAINAAKKSADAANISAIVAKKAVDYADSMYLITKESFKSSDANFIKSLNVVKKSADAATKSASLADSSFYMNKKGMDIAKSNIDLGLININLAQKNFEIQNRAYIFMGGVIVDTIKSNKVTNVNVLIKNFGKTPALVVASLMTYDFDTSNNKIVTQFPKNNLRYLNIYLAQEMAPFNISITIPPLSENDIKLIGTIFKLRVVGKILFRDMVTGRFYEYSFSIRVFPDAKYNSNFDNNFVKEVENEDKWVQLIK